MEISGQKAYQGILLEVIPVEWKRRKQNWAQGKIGLGCCLMKVVGDPEEYLRLRWALGVVMSWGKGQDFKTP